MFINISAASHSILNRPLTISAYVGKTTQQCDEKTDVSPGFIFSKDVLQQKDVDDILDFPSYDIGIVRELHWVTLITLLKLLRVFSNLYG